MEDVLDMYIQPCDKNRPLVCMDETSKQQVKETRKPIAMKELSDIHFKDAEKIVIVLDNLNTHNPSSFYEVFEPEEARRLTERFEFHYTPKHGSWLNMAEIELSVLSQQCLLNRRIPDKKALRKEVTAWKKTRNCSHVTIDWRFTTMDARIKLKRLYPLFND